MLALCHGCLTHTFTFPHRQIYTYIPQTYPIFPFTKLIQKPQDPKKREAKIFYIEKIYTIFIRDEENEENQAIHLEVLD